MFCSISGEVPVEPVISVKTGHLFEKRLIEKYLKAGNKCPISGVELAETDLLHVQGNRSVKPRSLVNTSIPGILSTLQNEWDEAMLETFTLKSHLDATRQELSQALYQHDAGCRVIARLMRERDEARAMLASATASMTVAQPSVAATSQPMVIAPSVPPQADLLNPSVVAAMNDKCMELSGTRKGRSKVLEAAGAVVNKEEIKDWESIRAFTSHKSDKGQVHCVAVATGLDGQPDIVLSGGSDNSAIMVNSESGAILSKLIGHTKKVSAIACFQSTGNSPLVFTGSADKTVKMWSQSDGAAGSPAPPPAKKGSKAAKNAVDKDLKSYAVSSTYSFHTGEVSALSVHPTGKYVLSMSRDGTWCLVDVENTSCLRQVHCNPTANAAVIAEDELLCGQLHPDGLILGTGTAGGVLKVWDIREQKCVAEFTAGADEKAGGVACVAFSENGYYLGSGAEGGGARIWDLRKLKCTKTLECEGNVITSLAFDYTAAFLALGNSAGGLRVTTVKDWTDVTTLPTLHTKAITGLSWGGQKAGAKPKSAYLATSSLDRGVQIVGLSN